MKIGFICLNLPGHLNPMIALARQLQTRGHDVVFLYLPNAHGLPCVPGNDKSDEVNATRPEVSKLSDWEALEFYVPVLAKETERILKSLPQMVETNGVDALVLDPIQFFAELGAIKLGLPYVSVGLAVYIDYLGHTPLCCYDWPHETTPEAVARNRQGVAQFTKLAHNEWTEAYAREAGIKGVPQLAIPVTFDQPGVAARIAAKNTGVTMPFTNLTSDHLSRLLSEVLNNPVYRENARRFQDIISRTNGLSMAADIVERSFGVTKKASDRQAPSV